MRIYQELHRILASGQEAIVTTSLAEGKPAEKALHALEPASEAALLEGLGAASMAEDSLALKSGDLITIIERLSPKPRMVVFGGGHIAAALLPMAADLELESVVYDDRPFFANPARFPTASEVVCDAFDQISLPLRPGDIVVIATRGHKHDEDCLSHVLSCPEPFYTGMIGSKRRVAIVRKRLADRGVDAGRLKRLHSPIGLPIGAVTPTEIAVSILAEIIQARRQAQKELGRGRLEAYADMALMKWLADREKSGGGEPAALVTVVSTKGSTPRKAGAKMATLHDGRVVGSIGGGCSEAAVIVEAKQPNPAARLMEVDLTDSAEEDGMVCGGRMEVLIEPLP